VLYESQASNLPRRKLDTPSASCTGFLFMKHNISEKEVIKRFNEFHERVTKEMPDNLTPDQEWEFMNQVCKETIEKKVLHSTKYEARSTKDKAK